MDMSEKSRSSKNKYIVILIILVALLIGVIFYLVITTSKKEDKEEEKKGGTYVASDASDWDANVDKPEATAGRILVPGYSGAQLKEGEKTLTLSVGNPKENHCYLKATVMLEDGTILYESDLLEPGKGYEQIKLNQSLSKGTYQAMVRYQGYTLEDKGELNSCDSAFVLTVIE